MPIIDADWIKEFRGKIESARDYPSTRFFGMTECAPAVVSMKADDLADALDELERLRALTDCEQGLGHAWTDWEPFGSGIGRTCRVCEFTATITHRTLT